MKKLIKRISLVLISVLLILNITISVNADAVYVVNGFAYNIRTNTTIAICGWEGESTDPVIPKSIAERNVVAIASKAFMGNESLTSVDFSGASYLNSIEMEAFSGCTSLSTVDIPYSVTALGESVFANCSSLQSVHLYANISNIPQMFFYNCQSLKEVYLPPYLKTIQKFAFGNCASLEYIEIPQSVTSIATSAFYNDNVVLGVYKDTYAHQFAADNMLSYIIIDGPKIGDANGDGVVDIFDATDIQKFAAEKIIFTDEQFELADINKDGYVDVMDALLVQKHVIGKYDIPEIIYNS